MDYLSVLKYKINLLEKIFCVHIGLKLYIINTVLFPLDARKDDLECASITTLSFAAFCQFWIF